MALGTFGAILGFALALEERAAAFYDAAAQATGDDAYRQLARSARKRMARVERARREGVNEMILEPIEGLDGDSYALGPAVLGAVDDSSAASWEARAARLAAEAARFYRDAGAKLPIRQVVRLFDRLADEYARRP